MINNFFPFAKKSFPPKKAEEKVATRKNRFSVQMQNISERGFEASAEERVVVFWQRKEEKKRN